MKKKKKRKMKKMKNKEKRKVLKKSQKIQKNKNIIEKIFQYMFNLFYKYKIIDILLYMKRFILIL